MILLLVFMALVHSSKEEQTPKYLVIAPNVIHLGVEETVSVQLHEAVKPTSIQLYFKESWGSKTLSETKTVNLNEDNQYQAVVTLKVDPAKYNAPTEKDKQHILLVSEMSEDKQMVHVVVSNRRGYIFIQTDKTIYNPGETVKYRIFTLDNYLLPINDKITVQIFNSKGLLVYRHVLNSEQILQKTVTIPDIELAGNWKITASYYNSPKSNSSVEFEVREYVLPSFEVKIEAAKQYLLLKHNDFQFRISARYTYGKTVTGVAYVRFGLIDSEGERTYLPGIEKQIKVEDGNADVIVLTKDIQSAAVNQNIEHITGQYLYIAATVLEKASGDVEEAESSSVKIVTSPYVIDLSRTKKYFSPGGMFSILGTASFPDGSRVPHLKIKANVNISGLSKTEEITGDKEGNFAITTEGPKDIDRMSIRVHVEGDDDNAHIISDNKIVPKAISGESGSYLSVEVPHQILNPDQTLQVTFRDITPAGASRPSHVYYLIVSKGRIQKVNRVQRTELTTIHLPFSVDMVPSFRLVAYYYSTNNKIVADSVWVDVKDVCKGKLEIVPFNKVNPAEEFDVLIKTDSDSKVALSAVDSAVYILNKKGKLSPQKMFEFMNSHDLGCSAEIENSKSVLETAGLSFICNCGTNSSVLTDHKCFGDSQRHKRDLNALVNSYKNQDRKCCEDGRKKGLLMKSCDQRMRFIIHQPQSCQEAFKKCCKAAADKRKKDELKRRMGSLGRSHSSGIEEDEIDEVSVYLRSFFPQSWMWEVLNADASGNIRHSTVAPDSITTWEVQAVALSPTQGFCIADPQSLRVFRDFFVSVKLPYSVKKNEQLEVKAVVFNYKQKSLEVTVKMDQVDGLCSAGSGDVVQKITVEPQSATAVYFTVVPLIIGTIPISILAYASHIIHDKIQKDLNVVGEGELVFIEREYNIDAKTDKLEFDIPAPEDEIPGQDSTTYMSFKGGVMGESVDNCLNLEGVNKLIRLPTGCAEQTMVKMSPAIHALKYLDATNQWISLKAERREEAQNMIQVGYTRVLIYKKDDGSYGAFLSTPSSIWLTAFIAKELTRARDIIDVEDLHIRDATSYLTSKQKANGAWDDPNPLYDRGMKGGVGQSVGDVPLTAYVLISFIRVRPVYEVGTDTELRVASEKARAYLLARFNEQQDLYAVAITAYALSLNNPQSPDATRAHRKLMDLATCDTKRCFWDVGGKVGGLDKAADAISVEATAYGLLQALTMQDEAKSVQIATWLTEQRKYGGGFRSTQDTVVALEALSKFSIQKNDVEDLDLRVEICMNDKLRQNLVLNKQTALTQTAIEVKEVGKVILNVKGQGNGTIAVMQTYRALKKHESFCDFFDLSVKVDGELSILSNEEEEDKKLTDYYNYDYDASEEPMSRQDWFDLRTRRKRQAPEEPPKENRLVYTVCVSRKQGNSTGMVLVDISLLTGLTPYIQDLEDNAKGTEKFIDHYDVYHNKVFLYFNQITDEETCVRFRAEQLIPVGLVQPAMAVIYDYYNPDRKCSVFYTVQKDNPMLAKLCEADVCACAEGGCPRLKVTFSKNMEKDTRFLYACSMPIVDYVYTVKILNLSQDGVFRYYSALITKVLQAGKDVGIQESHVREVLHRLSCDELNLKIDADYLIMGQNDAIFVGNEKSRFRYILNNKVWIEKMPQSSKCQATKSKQACQLLDGFMQSFAVSHCAV